MSLVATLISHPAKRVLTPDVATMAMKALDASAIDWLGENLACDIALKPGLEIAATEALLRESLAGAPVDVAVQEAEGRRKKMLIADMDSTMIDQECIDELAAELGLKDAVAAITSRAMNGEIDFEPALEERVALLRGLPLDVIDSVIEERITLASGGPTLVATMKAAGAFTALVSGGFEQFTGPVGDKLGFHTQQANRLLIEEDKLNGKVAKPILGRAAKAEALDRFAAEHSLTRREVLAVGDGANDLDMLGLAGLGVALHAKPAVAAQARVRIDHGDLTALLFLQGYRETEFVT
ncbi:phosphoserine phosphatase [Nitratireductor aquibiodomus]|uniref:Phosphoserine phosphatase n=1 Tax=Nitratireductor aquibiodomus TaxID=204799 RepID=A0A1H4J0D4_9HYPH|nr:phosphoserine phosphatase SerB [Nitratireductor aquibiodomus]SEB39774.1 phosphoserine phosphatase [Nitratireductor aquibiodomus]